MQIAKFLYSKGLVLTHLRELATSQSVMFTFIDNTPGSVHKQTCYYVQADLAERQGDLLYVPFDEFEDYIRNASFAEDIDITGLNILSRQL